MKQIPEKMIVLQKKKGKIFFFMITFSICFFMILIVLFYQNKNTTSLPKLSVEDIVTDNGFEIYLAYDICELSDANPWKEQWNLTTLPVFYNTNYNNNNSNATYDKKINIMAQKMEQLQIQAKQFGVFNTKEPIYDTITGILKSDTITFSIEMCTDKIHIDFHTPIALSDDTKLNTKEGAEKLLFELIDTYQYKFNWQECEPALLCGYSYEGIRKFQLHAYKKGNTLEEQLLNYHFNTAWFQTDAAGHITSIIWTKENLSQKIGDYPIISPKKAKQLLFTKNYITTVPYCFGKNMPIVKTEMAYLHHSNNSIFMPYYKFFVQLPVEKNGMKQYGVYYTPAVEEQYLKNSTVSK